MDAWADEFPLYIWSGAERADLSMVRQTVQLMRQSTGYSIPKVVPIGTSVQNPPPLDARVLAIGAAPAYLCDFRLIDPAATPDEWWDALAWVMRLEEDGKATTLLDTIQATFGAKAREISADELVAEQKMSDYLNRMDEG